MQDASAVKAALTLLHMPANVRLVREAPLPSGMVAVLQIAAREPGALAAAEQATGRSADTLVSAARFYIEQVLWHPRADHFRLLGSDAGASSAELKRNMALLMTWLHPDTAGTGTTHSAYIARVTAAWNDLKTPERREAYEARLTAHLAEAAQRRRHFKARIAANHDRIQRVRRHRASLWQRMWSIVARRPDA